MDTDVLIVGAGLSGLALADCLQTAGVEFHVAEARRRVGGRIVTERIGGAGFDLGPAWFWPGQPRMAALAVRFGLQVFEQFVGGRGILEDRRGVIDPAPSYASMAGSLRVAGGLGLLVEGLAAGLAPGRLRLGARVTGLARGGHGIEAALANGQGAIRARRVVLAVPPRVAAGIALSPDPGPLARAAMRAVPTWMAGQAKILATYPRPFWREQGLSGDGFSQRGPMAEIHDASPVEGGPYALFGFVGVPAEGRAGTGAALLQAATAQLGRMFGAAAAEPATILLKDWATEPETATAADFAVAGHPAYGRPATLSGLWDGRLHFGSTEMAPTFGGYLEGALEAADGLCADLGAC